MPDPTIAPPTGTAGFDDAASILDSVEYAIELLSTGAPLEQTLGAIAAICEPLGSAAVLTWPDGQDLIVSGPGSSSLEWALLGSALWTAARNGDESVLDLSFLDENLREIAKNRGYSGVRTLPINAPGQQFDPYVGPNDPLGAILVWTLQENEHLLAGRDRMRTAARLAALAIVEDAAKSGLRRVAFSDALTGLTNRAGLDAFLRGMAGRRCAAIYLDLDDFKPINDEIGHDGGDIVLKEVGRRLRDVTRPTDCVARLGGDEFFIVCPDLNNPTAAEALAHRLLIAISRPMSVKGHSIRVSASFGISIGATGDMVETRRQADEAMYEAKRAGKGRIGMAAAPVPATV